MVTREEALNRLENVTLPSIRLESHRVELRAFLLKEYSLIQTQPKSKLTFTWLQRPPTWKAILIPSAAWVLVAVIMMLSILIPTFSPESVSPTVVQAVLASKEVRAALGNDEMATVTANDLGNQLLEIIVESRGGAIIIAKVDTRNDTLKFLEISYVILLGSIYEPEQQITGEEREKVINTAKTDNAFQELLNRGFVIYKTAVVDTVISTRHIETGKTTQTSWKWAIIDLELQNTQWAFFIDTENGRVINRGERTIQKR